MRFSLLSSANHAVTIIASVARSEWLPPGYPYPPTFPCRTFRTIDCRPSEYGPWQIRTLVEWSNFRNVKNRESLEKGLECGGSNASEIRRAG
jgi:hypothetical protein